MLPDLPKLKGELQARLDEYLRKRAQSQLGVFSDVPRVFVHEGDWMRTVRADGSTEDTQFKEASAQFVIQRSEVASLTAERRKELLDGMADEMAQQVSKNLFATLNATLAAAGQLVDAKGKELSSDVVLETLEMMHLEFGPDGNPINLKWVVHPDMAPKVTRIQEEFETDQALKRRYNELMHRKRMESRAREATRKLVG